MKFNKETNVSRLVGLLAIMFVGIVLGFVALYSGPTAQVVCSAITLGLLLVALFLIFGSYRNIIRGRMSNSQKNDDDGQREE